MNDIPGDIGNLGKGLGASLAGLAALIQTIKRGEKGAVVPSKSDPREIIALLGEAAIQTSEVVSQIFQGLVKVNRLAVRADAKVDVLIEELGSILSSEALERLRKAAAKEYADDDA
jgi:hypothetical protein